MDISCDNCACSLCKYWKICNDHTHKLDYWCYRCHDIEIDNCFEQKDNCEKFVFDKNYTHPVYCLKTIEEAGQYYERFEDRLVYRETYIS